MRRTAEFFTRLTSRFCQHRGEDNGQGDDAHHASVNTEERTMDKGTTHITLLSTQRRGQWSRGRRTSRFCQHRGEDKTMTHVTLLSTQRRGQWTRGRRTSRFCQHRGEDNGQGDDAHHASVNTEERTMDKGTTHITLLSTQRRGQWTRGRRTSRFCQHRGEDNGQGDDAHHASVNTEERTRR